MGEEMVIEFICYVHPEPQGSSRAFIVRRKSGKLGAAVTSANAKMKPFRHELAQAAVLALRETARETPVASAKEPVSLDISFYFQRPASAKKRQFPSVKPDIDKLSRSCLDALTGILYADDAQVVDLTARKRYGVPERVEVRFEPQNN